MSLASLCLMSINQKLMLVTNKKHSLCSFSSVLRISCFTCESFIPHLDLFFQVIKSTLIQNKPKPNNILTVETNIHLNVQIYLIIKHMKD